MQSVAVSTSGRDVSCFGAMSDSMCRDAEARRGRRGHARNGTGALDIRLAPRDAAVHRLNWQTALCRASVIYVSRTAAAAVAAEAVGTAASWPL